MTNEERIKSLEDMQEKNQILATQILDSIMRLERIVMINTFDIVDINKRLDELENRKKKVQ